MIPAIQSNYNMNFTSGLNKNLLARGLVFDTRNFETKLAQKCNIDADFKGNKPVGFAFAKVCEIFNILQNRLGKTLFSLPCPRVRAYDKSDLVIENKTNGFCIPETRSVLKNELPFETGSLFQEKENSLENWDYTIETDFKSGKRSSGHFLADTLHELMHSVYINHIYKKYGYNGNCPYTRAKYPRKESSTGGLNIIQVLQNKTFTSGENVIIREILGEYAAKPHNQYHEVFAETFSKIICASLSPKDALPQKNPMELLAALPKEFLGILHKILNI